MDEVIINLGEKGHEVPRGRGEEELGFPLGWVNLVYLLHIR